MLVFLLYLLLINVCTYYLIWYYKWF